jgi:hypothetical protein
MYILLHFLKETAQSKQLLNRRKFAQSGHPEILQVRRLSKVFYGCFSYKKVQLTIHSTNGQWRQGDQMILQKKVAQNIAQPVARQN